MGNHVRGLTALDKAPVEISNEIDLGNDQGETPQGDDQKSSEPKGSNNCQYKPARYSQKTARLRVVGNVVDPTPENGTDCSGFVSGVLCRVGARLKPSDDNCGPYNSEEMINWGTKNDCFQTAEFTASAQLRPGCLVVWKNKKTGYGHTVVIEKVGPDPFGLREERNCNELPPFKNWDFQIAESLLATGPSRWTGSSRFSQSRWDKVPITILYKQACRAVNGGRALPAEVSLGDWRIKVLCHSGNSKPNCVGKERVFKDEACIANCTEN